MKNTSWKITIETFRGLSKFFNSKNLNKLKYKEKLYKDRNICLEFHYKVPEICNYIYKTLTIEKFQMPKMEDNFRASIRGVLNYTPQVKVDYPTLEPSEIKCTELQPGYCSFLYKSNDFMPLYICGSLMLHSYNVLVTSIKVFSCARNEKILDIVDRWDEEDFI